MKQTADHTPAPAFSLALCKPILLRPPSPFPLAPCVNELCASWFFVCWCAGVSVVVGNAVVNCRLSRQNSRR